MDPLTIAIIGGTAFAFGYGSSDFCAKKTLNRISDLNTLFYMQIVGIFLLPLYFFIDPTLPEIKLSSIAMAAVFAIMYASANLFLFKAFSTGKVSLVSPIASSYVVGVAIVSFLAFGESLSGAKAMFIALVVIGVVLTSFDLKQLRNGFQIGDLGSGLKYLIPNFLILSFMYPLLDQFLDVDGWVFWLIIMRIFIVIFLAGIILVNRGKFIVKQAGQMKTWIFAIALFEVIGFLGSSWAYSESSDMTSVIVAIGGLFPLVAGVLAHLFLKERLATNQYFGALVILGGLTLLPFI